MSAPDPLPPLPGGFSFDCGPDKMPGWLNQDGLPTSCVGDLPMPAPLVDVPAPLTVLPVTGVEVIDLLVPVILVALGALCAWIDRQTRGRPE